MQLNKYSLILASKSPRRKEFFDRIGIDYVVRVKDMKETSSCTDVYEIAVDIAGQKGRAVYDKIATENGFGTSYFPIVVAADTIVAIDGKSFGKPRDRDDARKMLKAMSSREHQVVTGVYIGVFDKEVLGYRESSFANLTEVMFHKLSDEAIDEYLDLDEYADKAGGYGIQGAASKFVSGINGLFSNVVGLPEEVYVQKLQDLMKVSDMASLKDLFCENS